MKALHVTPVFYPAYGDGGPVVAYYELCQSLAKHGCEIKVLTTDAHGWSRSLEVETEREIEIEPNFRVRILIRSSGDERLICRIERVGNRGR